MSALLPTLIAVLLAETGGSLGHLRGARRPMLAAGIAGLMTGVAAAGSLAIAPQLTPEARLLMLAIALVLAGFARLARVRPSPESIATLPAALLMWRSTAPFTVFAFSVWLNDPFGAALGALAALGAAVIIPPFLPRAGTLVTGALLIALGLIAAINGLRLA